MNLEEIFDGAEKLLILFCVLNLTFYLLNSQKLFDSFHQILAHRWPLVNSLRLPYMGCNYVIMCCRGTFSALGAVT